MLRSLGEGRKYGAFRFDFGPPKRPTRAKLPSGPRQSSGPFHLEGVEKKSSSGWWVTAGDGKDYWLHEKVVYVTNETGLDPADVEALIVSKRLRKERQIDRARLAVKAAEEPTGRKRRSIPVEVRQAVFERDGGRCVECGDNFDIQYDHVIPHSLGGADTVENLQLLCVPCNQSKGVALA